MMLSTAELLATLEWRSDDGSRRELDYYDLLLREHLEHWLLDANGMTDEARFALARLIDSEPQPGWMFLKRTPVATRAILCDEFACSRAQVLRETLTARAADGASPELRVRGARLSVRVVSTESDRSAQLVQRAQGVLKTLEARAPSAAAIVAHFTHEVMFVEESVSATFGSSSWPGLIGRTALVNMHLDEVTDAMVVNGLIHEAIHSLLYVCELSRPLCPEARHTRAIRIQSPWTSRTLALPSYVHACLVWYGLWMFWRDRDVRRAFLDDEAIEMLRRAEIGFRVGRLRERLGLASAHVTPFFLELLSSVEARTEAILRDCP